MIFKYTPIDYCSVNSDIVYVVYDANSIDPAKLDYKYVGEVWIGGVKVDTQRVYPNPTNNFGIFEISTIVRESISVTLLNEFGDGNFFVDVVMKIREEYNGTIGSVVATSTSIRFFNHYNGRINEFTKLYDYVDKCLTNRPSTIYILQNINYFYVPYFADSGSPFDVVIDGTTTTYTPAAAGNIMQINIAAGVNYDYDVVIDGVTYNVKTICDGRYDNYTIHFINKWGAFESVLFNKVSKKTVDITKKSYNKLSYRVNNTTGDVTMQDNTFSPAKIHEQRVVFGGTFTEKLRISTDLLTNEEWEWLSQLVMSPMIYLNLVNSGEANLYPVTITNSNYDVKNNFVDGLQQLSIEIEFGVNYKTQFR